jgi:L-threonylcarbamoyladenylate synthase
MTPLPQTVGVDEIDRVLEALRSGSVVGIPTDTVYGLAAILDSDAIARVFEAKGRPDDLALPVLVGAHPQVGRVTASFSQSAVQLTERFWPGALTVVARARREVGRLVGGHGRTVGVRWPDHPFVEELCLAAGPLAVTSANRHGAPPCTTAHQLREQFDPATITLVVDGGECAGAPSTVVDCSGRRPRCLREGALMWEELEAALG